MSMNTSGDKSPLMSIDEVRALVPCSRSFFRKLCEQGKAPKPIRLGRLTRWSREEINAWMAARCPSINEAANTL